MSKPIAAKKQAKATKENMADIDEHSQQDQTELELIKAKLELTSVKARKEAVMAAKTRLEDPETPVREEIERMRQILDEKNTASDISIVDQQIWEQLGKAAW